MEEQFTLTREIAAQPDAVFRALTEPSELDRWWTTSSDSDPRTGGAFEYRWEFDQTAGREDHRQSGAYEEVVADRRLVYPWQAASGATTVEVTLAPSGDGTTVELVHRGWGEGEAWDESVRMHQEGWGFFLDNLKTYLEQGEDRRSAMGLKTPAASRASA